AAAGRADGVAHLLPSFSVAVEVAGLEFDFLRFVPCPTKRTSTSLVFSRSVLSCHLQAHVRADHESVRWVIDERARPAAFASIRCLVVDGDPARGSDTISASSA